MNSLIILSPFLMEEEKGWVRVPPLFFPSFLVYGGNLDNYTTANGMLLGVAFARYRARQNNFKQSTIILLTFVTIQWNSMF